MPRREPTSPSHARSSGESGTSSPTSPTSTPSPGVVPYHINAGMWSDPASPQHVLGVPGSDAIVTADGRQIISGRMWYFPSNTVFARTLTLELEQGHPSSSKRIETQLLHFDGRAWNLHWPDTDGMPRRRMPISCPKKA